MANERRAEEVVLRSISGLAVKLGATYFILFIYIVFHADAMWRLSSVRHKAVPQGRSLEEFKLKRREHEKVLRSARKDNLLVSKRLLLCEDEDETPMDAASGDQVVHLVQKLQQSGQEKETHLKALSGSLRNPSAQTVFIKHENSMHLLVGLLSGSQAQWRLLALQCLHELSQSHQPNVTLACVPATPYLLTYLSGQSTKLTELCLYTLGNLCPGSDVVRDKLLAQGIIPALKNCMESQRSNLAVVEAVGFTLSQLLQAKDAAEKITPAVLASGLPSLLRSVLSPDPQFGLAPAIECAWCLHYLTCSTVGSSALRADGTLSRCSSLLVALGGAVSKGTKEEGMELLVWPLLRSVGNLLSSGPPGDMGSQGGDLLPALCALARAFLPSHPALALESAWVLNNLTADSSELCTALLDLNLVPELIQLLPFSQGINTMLLRVLGNVAHQTNRSCSQLARAGLVPALCATLRMSEPDVVALSLEVLFMLVAGCPQAAEEFVGQNGTALLEAVQYNGDGEIRQRAAHLLEHHLPAHLLEHHLPAHLL
ncbi:transmembrane and coiled-coil domain-containing protein 6 isoform X1 [Gadus macrocephalus]|uniref:transmembrane and coiled-coil domain-containing protein 6 isoform X1 n=2 Tax=Gadus macrocephalus TaxID=80720 RepID=UPI0028CB6F65|nr:transmembrane and coiled-coil domain-containing protein 6 isoform X1 [Gadus macrocephalus]XP_059919336.1 transmembrane and coiled-coil domain-containing protein 6 isoform X1 [Gadus macrocephalus]XP_059919337.1 transmembrane and coiled-coil domain-containing protein 6 isoform X1 [Gadus macrocephalus]